LIDARKHQPTNGSRIRGLNDEGKHMSTIPNAVMPTRLIRLHELRRRVPLSRTRIFELMAEGRFPKNIKLSDRASAWDAAQIEQWIAERKAAA
jgi:prophage regulatory protein